MPLRRELGLIHVFCIAAGAMISSGIFVLPGLAHAKAGPAVIVSYFLAGLLAAPGMLCVAELATAMPRAGGDYFYVTRTLGPAVGTVAGLLTWFSLTLKSSFALVGMAAFAAALIKLDPRLLALAFGVVFVAINVFGVKEAARLQVALVVGLLGLMAFYVVRGLAVVDTKNLDPIAPHGLAAVVSTAGFVFVSYGGLLKVSSVAEEVRNPARVVPLGMMLALLVVGALYTLMVLVTTGVLPGTALDNSLTPISDGAERFLGRGGRTALSVAAFLAFITTANAGVMAASRYLLALSRDELAPPFVGRVTARFGTPFVAVLITGLVMGVAVFLELNVLIKAASTVLILTYLLSCLCVIILRESRVQNYQPKFRTPLYPWLPLLGITGFLFLIFEMGLEAFIVSIMLVAAGFFVYWFYGRRRASREYALLHLVQRITSRDLVTGSLERELKEIVRERDEIVADRFDQLVESCPVLDLAGATPVDAFFEQAAGALAGRLGLAPPELLGLLRKRESDSSTVLTPVLAVPHIVIEGERRFDMLLARCRDGIRFSDEAPAVRAVFVLAGSRDDRNLHLRVLAAIAQIAQDPEFDRKWRAARGEQALRDLLLLGKRRRG